MADIRFLTAGESHGKALVGIIEGIPANLLLSSRDIDTQLKRRQGGFGRGGRMKIESDHTEILSGVRWGRTIGSPIALMIENRDFGNWQEGMSVDERHEGAILPVTKPRPGHADLAGVLKYNQTDIRNILERSSARETAMRVALGSVARKFLSEFGIMIGSFVTQIGPQKAGISGCTLEEHGLLKEFRRAEGSDVRCPDEKASRKMVALITEAIKKGNSLGGVFEVFAVGVPAGLGSHIQWDKRLDGLLAQAIASIQAIKAVEVGSGYSMTEQFGSDVLDEIRYRKSSQKDTSLFFRSSNHAGGIEGGMTNGMPLLLRAGMKPIPTMKVPLGSVDIRTKKAVRAAYERSDVCAVPAAAVIAESMMALVLASTFLEKFGGDSVEEVKKNYRSYCAYLRKF